MSHIFEIAVVLGLCVVAATGAVAAPGVGGTDAMLTQEALLDTLQHTAFDFFWNEANPANMACAGSWGVLKILCVYSSPSRLTQKSVNVPPMSTPTNAAPT